MDDSGVSKGRTVAVGVIDRWKVTCHMSHVTHDMRLVTKVPEKSPKVLEN